MMNKTKSAKRQAARFLFLIPVLAIILISFRKSFSDAAATQTGDAKPVFTDTVPEVKMPNSKGYIINIKDKSGEREVVIKDRNNKEVKRLLLTEWNEKPGYFENLYGKIPPPPPPSAPAEWKEVKLPENVKNISTGNRVITVTLKDGTKEQYNLNNEEEKKTFDKKYGNILPPSPPAPLKTKKTAAQFEKKEDIMTVTDFNGKKEIYNLADPVQKAEFETLYAGPVAAVTKIKSVNGVATTVSASEIAKTNLTETVIVSGQPVVMKEPLDAMTITERPVSAAVIKTKAVNAKGPVTATLAEVPVNLKEIPVEEKADILTIGGLSMKDEKQYILLDGAEYNPKPGEKLKGTFRIMFIDKADAVKKYGEKAKNGAIIVETIKQDR